MTIDIKDLNLENTAEVQSIIKMLCGVVDKIPPVNVSESTSQSVEEISDLEALKIKKDDFMDDVTKVVGPKKIDFAKELNVLKENVTKLDRAGKTDSLRGILDKHGIKKFSEVTVKNILAVKAEVEALNA